MHFKKTASRAFGFATGLFILILAGPSQVVAQCELDKLTAMDGAAGDAFGASVAIARDYAVVGASFHDDNGPSSGAAYVFERQGIVWVQVAELLASDGAQSDLFGSAASISRDRILLGANGHDAGGPFSSTGAAYVFHRVGSAWIEEDKLLADDLDFVQHMGISVSISGDRAVAGAPFNDEICCNSGAVYVFRREGTNWVQEQKLTASDAASGDQFGRRVAISGDIIVVGSHLDDDLGDGSGSAYVFRRQGTTWVEVDKLTASDGGFADRFGISVAIDGKQLVVGAEFAAFGRGAAYVFRAEANGAIWLEEDILIASDGAPADQFGESVSISRGHVLVGALLHDDPGESSGSAYLFRSTGAGWSEVAKLTPNDLAAGDVFGASVSISPSYAAVGATFDDDAGNNSGSAYVFGVSGDCNGNGSPDACDILDGVACDCNDNGVPDECEGCIGDLDGDGTVGVKDLLILLGSWGPCDCCPADLNCDGVVDGADQAILEANWGPCP